MAPYYANGQPIGAGAKGEVLPQLDIFSTLPSYTRRGIWEAKWVVRRGVRWRVGNGESVRVWSDPWVPGTQSRRIISLRGNSPLDLEVGAFINPITRNWNA